MEKMHYSIKINAPKEKVWETMLGDATYREWTDAFSPSSGSYFEGDWSEGSSMRFVGPEKDGSVSGMYSTIKESRPHDFISIKHLGEIHQGEEKPWPGEMYENYTFVEEDGVTEVLVDLMMTESDAVPNLKEMFESTWPKALEKLKELAEK